MKSKCCNAEVFVDYPYNDGQISPQGYPYCSKCGEPCETIEENKNGNNVKPKQ